MPVCAGKLIRETISDKQTYLKSTVLASVVPQLRSLKPGQRMPCPSDEGAHTEAQAGQA
jgi:hypothetical protein